MNRRLVPLMLAAAMAAAALAAPGQAQAVNAAQSVIVSADPADFTPQVEDGQVEAVAIVGNTVVIGGTFTTVADKDELNPQTRNFLAAFDATTGALSATFQPQVDGEVTSLVAGPNNTVYVGGAFAKVGGVPHQGLTQLSVATGARVPAFNAYLGTNTGGTSRVNAMVLRGTRLYVGGRFSKVTGVSRSGLAAVDSTTGAVTPFSVQVTDSRSSNSPAFVRTLDVTSDASTMVVAGNFLTVGGQPREQLAIVDLTTSAGAVTSWQTTQFHPASSIGNALNFTYIEQLDISPDGSYFVVGTTGGKTDNSLCDSASRWELGRTGGGQVPTWVDYTGGDTLNSVAITGAAVYVAGHPRWFNNFLGSDAAGPGAVARQTIAALDPDSGLPLPWNPKLARPGPTASTDGPQALVATAQGLWVGWDADTIGVAPTQETHKRITFFPTAGGTTPPAAQPNNLPGTLYLAGSDGSLSSRSISDSLTFGAGAAVPNPGPTAWDQITGGFLAAGSLFFSTPDGVLHRAPFDGSTVGAVQDILTPGWDLTGVRAMTYADGRIYYTTGDGVLHYRYFLPSAATVGTQELTASTGAFPVSTDTREMFVAAGSLYLSHATDLYRMPMTGGMLSGDATAVSTDHSWTGTGSFLSSAPVKPFTRLSGAGRMDTAVAVSQQQFTAGSAGAVVLARADAFPDGLAGVPFAHAKNAPLLLTLPSSLYAPVKTEIQRVLPPGGTVYMLGGTGALSATVQASITAMGYTVVRLAGSSRFDTALAIANAVPGVTNVLLATGLDFPDALGAGAAAAANHGVVLLTNGPTLTTPVKNYLTTFLAAHPTALVWGIGVQGATAGAPYITSPSRKLAGATRIDTAVDIATAMFPAPQRVVLVFALNYPDGLSGGPYAAANGAPVLLTTTTPLSSAVGTYLRANSATILSGTVVGGPGVVSDSTLAAAAIAIT